MNDPFQDDDLVYVDPDTKEIIGKLEWDVDGNPLSKQYPKKEGKKFQRKFFPYGTLRSLRRAFRLEGKQSEESIEESLDEIMPKVLRDEL